MSDRLEAELTAIRERANVAALNDHDKHKVARSAADVPRLVDVIDAVLDEAQRMINVGDKFVQDGDDWEREMGYQMRHDAHAMRRTVTAEMTGSPDDDA